MQSACPRCQVRFAFDAAAIPADGYEARCHRCGATFFVAPPAAADAPAVHHGPPAPTSAEALGLSRAMAETLAAEGERFARRPSAEVASRRPSLASLFDGDLHAEAAPDGGRNDDGSSPATSTAVPQAGLDDDAVVLGAPAPAHAGATAAATPRKRTSRPWAHVGEGTDAEYEAPPRSRARLGLVLGMVCVALVTLGVVVGVVRSEQLHLPTQVPPPLHIVRDPPPEAVAAFERGMAALRRDNADELERAAQAFADARAIDADYTDAWAGEALARLLRAEGAQARALAVEGELAQAAAELAVLADAQGARAQLLVPSGNDGAGAGGDEGDDDGEVGTNPVAHRALEVASAALRLRTLARGQAALQVRLAEATATARREQVQAASLLLHAEQLLGQTPLLATVVALWLADDPLQQTLAPEQIKVAEQLGARAVVQPRRSWGDPPGPTGLTAPYAAWRMLARAQLVKGRQPAVGGPAEAVVATYEAALRLDDGLRRARYLYAEYLASHGRPAEAELHLRQMLQAEPRHQQASSLLERLQAHAN